jgi:hypothetical protein
MTNRNPAPTVNIIIKLIDRPHRPIIMNGKYQLIFVSIGDRIMADYWQYRNYGIRPKIKN